MTLFIEQLEIKLTEDQYGLRLNWDDAQLPLPGQTLATATDLLQKNFATVKGRFSLLASDTIPAEELDEVSLKVVLHYFYLYNSWKYSNEKEKDRDLAFLQKDFHHPYTYDIILQYFKLKYPGDYALKCACLTEKTADELLKYEYDRDSFYNSFR